MRNTDSFVCYFPCTQVNTASFVCYCPYTQGNTASFVWYFPYTQGNTARYICYFPLQKFEYFVRGCTCQLQKIKTIWRHGNVWILLYAKLSIIAFISWREHILYIKFLIYIDWLVLNIYSIDYNMFQWIIGIRLNTFQLFLLI